MRANKRIINYRPMLFIAVAIMIGIVAGLFVLNNTLIFWGVIIVLAISSITLLLLKNYKLAVVIISILIGCGAHFLQYKVMVTTFNEEELCLIESVVSNTYNYGDLNYVTLENLNIDGFKVRGKATIKTEEEFSINDNLKFFGYVKNQTNNLWDKQTLADYASGRYYQVYPISNIDISPYKASFYQRVKNRMTAPMKAFLTAENNGIANSLLFGDKRSLSYTDKVTMRATGLSHIFAVSGLHICFIVALIIFAFKKLKLNRWLSLLLTAIILFIYCAIVDFPPSALRAMIMALIVLLATVLHKKNDALSTLSLAIVIILLINPATLFALSFIMSISAVFGIILFFTPIKRFMSGNSENKFRLLLANSVALSVSANVFLLPIFINTFGMVATYFVFANLIVLPLVSLTYMYLFIVACLCIPFSRLGFLYMLANPIISIIRFITMGISTLPYATILTKNIGIFAVSYVSIMVLSSRFIFLSKYKKSVGVLAIMVVSTFLFLIF